MSGRRMHATEVDAFIHQAGLLERDVGELAYPRPGERLVTWLGRAARGSDAREALWLAVSLGLLGGGS